MTYTTQQLQAMGDKEINSALIKKLGIPHKVDKLGVFIDHGFEDGAVYYTFVDYCNNPNDIMPLAFERGIGFASCSANGDWLAACGKHQFTDIRPLRAIACLLLMMDE